MANWASLPLRLRLYILTVVVTATPLLCLAIRDMLYEHYGYSWLVLTAIALVTVPIFVFLPSVSTTVGIGDAFVISICMLNGASPAIVANILYTIFQTLLFRQKQGLVLYRIVFNIAASIINVWLYSHVYFFLNPKHSPSLEDIILPTFGLAITFFLSNSFLVATAVSLSSNRHVFRFWYLNYRGVILDFMVSACAGAFILAFSNFHVMAPLLVAPFVAAVWGINKTNKAKTIEAERHLKEQERLYLRTVESLALAVDAKDQTTYGHIRRVRAYALGLARLCGITDTKELMAIETGSLLHDIGKLAIDDYILNKPGRLTKQEFEKMKLHASAGDEILQQIQFPFPVAKYVRYHHEKWDGTGYPDGLKGEAIPLGARILSIADAFDAIRSSRPYKLSFGIKDSIELLRAQSGTMYDPTLLEQFIAHIDELEKDAAEAAKNIPELSFRRYSENPDRDTPSRSPSPLSFHPSLPPTISAELMELNEFCTTIGKHLTLDDVLSSLSRRLRRILPCTTSVFFFDTGNNQLKALTVSGKHSDLLSHMTIGIGKGISGWVAAYSRPIVNTGPALEFQDIQGDFTSLTDTLVVPLLLDSRCIGTISLYAEAPTFYSQAHLALLELFAGQAAPLLADCVREQSLTKSSDDILLDPVTSVYRLPFLSLAGSQMIATAERTNSQVSLLYVDVHRVQQVLQMHGTLVADIALKRIADILRSELRDSDVIVRIGYHAFAALLPGVRPEYAVRLSHRLHHQIRSYAIDGPGQPLHVACDTAISTYPIDAKTILELLQHAQQTISTSSSTNAQFSDATDTKVVEFPPRP